MSDVATAPPPGNAAAVRRRRKLWVVALVVIVAVAVAVTVWFAHWRSSLHALIDYPNYGVGMPTAPGHSWYFGSELASTTAVSVNPRQLSIDITSVKPVVIENNADADVAVLRCVLRHPGAGPVGERQVATDAICASLTPFRSGRVTLGFEAGNDDIVVEVTPHKAGVVRINGVDVRYRSGLRHGSQHAGGQLRVTAKG